MATLTIRNLDDDLKALLRLRAARHGRSMGEEARRILCSAARAVERAVPGRQHSRQGEAVWRYRAGIAGAWTHARATGLSLRIVLDTTPFRSCSSVPSRDYAGHTQCAAFRGLRHGVDRSWP